mgnify:CR=1 FL=1
MIESIEVGPVGAGISSEIYCYADVSDADI